MSSAEKPFVVRSHNMRLDEESYERMSFPGGCHREILEQPVIESRPIYFNSLLKKLNASSKTWVIGPFSSRRQCSE